MNEETNLIRQANAELENVLSDSPKNITAICKVARTLHQLGDRDGFERAFAHCAALLRKLAEKDRVDIALKLEAEIYDCFVKREETEGNYHRCFSHWKKDMEEMGRRVRGKKTVKPPLAPNTNIAVVLPVGVILGHTEVLFRMMESKPEINLRFCVIDLCTKDFIDRARSLSIGITQCPAPTAESGIVGQLTWLREKLEADAFHCVIWPSTPVYASFMLSMQLAPVQIFWALRFHPFALTDVDGYITFGAWSEETREFWGQKWQVCPVPLALSNTPPQAHEVLSVRANFPQKFLFGTLARDEKMDSKPFLTCVVDILKRNPETGFLWTGVSLNTRIAQYFEENGVAHQCHFIGWVDSRLYAASLDVFLETFPLGCGITGYQALSAGVPVLSYLERDTIFGMQYWSDLVTGEKNTTSITEDMLQKYSILVARDQADYVDKATRLYKDHQYRRDIGDSGRRFFESELNNSARYTNRFFQTVLRIEEDKLDSLMRTQQNVLMSEK